MPEADCVLFADPKQSRIDIVQAAGRALRHYPGKDYGYILLPLIVPRKMNFDDFAETTAFRQVARTITALSTQDERIADEFRAIERGHISSGKIVEIEGDVPIGMKIKLSDFAEAISTRIWESVGRANWRSFKSARHFVRSLRLKSFADWDAYRKSDHRPYDIPTNPNTVYARDGWISLGDWLGTGTIATHLRKYRPFEEARSFAHTLALKSQADWDAYVDSGGMPSDLPRAPHMVYADTGWRSWGDWLGTGRIAHQLRKYRLFREARAFARSLGLKTRSEWLAFARSEKLPSDIPRKPERVYASKGWRGVGDWLGTGIVASQLRKYRLFTKARTFARSLGLSSANEWRAFCKSHPLPADIPANPKQTYLDKGWNSWADWLGTTKVATNQRRYRPYREAKVFVHCLGLKSANAWRAYTKSAHFPKDLPVSPNRIYANTGWSTWGEWLGTGKVAPQLRQFRSFKKARAFVRSLRLKSQAAWQDYYKSGKKPDDISTAPEREYAGVGWAGLRDWLGSDK